MSLYKFLCSGIGFVAEEDGTWAEGLWQGLRPVLIVFFALVAAAAVGYSIFLGFLLAKSEDAAKRKQAKSRIIKTIFGLFVILVLVSVVLSGFIDSITTNTKDRVRFEIEEMNFSLTEVNGSPKQLIVRRDGAIVSDKVEFVKVAGIGTIHNGKAFSSSETGIASVNVLYEGKYVAEVLINVRPVGEPPPPKEKDIIPGATPTAAPAPGTPGTGSSSGKSGDTGVTIPPPTVAGDGTPLGDMRAWCESNLFGRSGYAQLGTPHRTSYANGPYMTHYKNGSAQVSHGAYFFDCSSFTGFIANRFGRTINSTSGAQKESAIGVGKTKTFTTDPQPGDWFFTPGHVGIYLGQIGTVKEFGTFGNTYSGHIYIHVSGGTGNGQGFPYSTSTDASSSKKYNKYMKGACYGSMTKQSNGTFKSGSNTVEFGRMFDFTNGSIRFSPYALKP